MNRQILIYQVENGKSEIEVQLEGETVWLSLLQIAELFEKDKSVISRHLSNIFREEELEKSSTVANFATVQKEGKRQVSRNIEFYNLDAIISVGYRVNSKRGIQFRQWATQKLKNYLVQGYALNHKQITAKGLGEIQKTLELISKTLHNPSLVDLRETEILSLILTYSKTWNILFKFDENDLGVPPTYFPSKPFLEYEEILRAIDDLKRQLFQYNEATELFGQQRENQLQGILGNLEQTFEGMPLYVSREEKAAHLLYFVIKDHPFSDGNKRIGSLLFLLYLKTQGIPLTSFNDTALISLALLIARSNPLDKDIIIRLVINMLAA